jgi:flagellar hook-associated protein 1 FlgK
MGADWGEVHQIRNEFLDVNFRNNVSQLQFYSTKVQTGIAIQTTLGELHGAYRFQDVLNDIWMSLQELTVMPEGLATRQFFLSNANSFITKAQSVFEDLIDHQKNLDLQIREMVVGRNGINATVAAIAELNKTIRYSESVGEKANDYRDERHRLLDHLATMIPIDVWQGPNGDMNITSLGHHILSGTTQSMMGLRFIANEMPFVEPVFTTDTDILSAGTPTSEFTPYLNYDTPLLPGNNNDRGQLLALLQARGNAPANHLSADVQPPMHPDRILELSNTVITAFAQYLPTDFAGEFSQGLALVVAAVNAEIANATDENQRAQLMVLRDNLVEARDYDARDRNRFLQRIVETAAGTPAHTDLLEEVSRDFSAQTHNYRAHMWSLENAMIPQAQMNLDRIVNSGVTMINDALTGNLRGIDGNFLFFVKNGDGTPYIPDPNDIDPVTNQPRRVPIRPLDGNVPPVEGMPLFIRESDIRERDARVAEAHANGEQSTWRPAWPFEEAENPNRADTIFTASNIRINPDFLLAGGHNHLALSLSGNPGDTDLLNAIQNVWMSNEGPYAIGVSGQNFNVQDAYIRIISAVATETSEANSKVTSQTIKVDQAHNMRMAVKGVSMDEEMSAMLRFQFAFQAASRAFNVIDSMIDKLINGTGRVGL